MDQQPTTRGKQQQTFGRVMARTAFAAGIAAAAGAAATTGQVTATNSSNSTLATRNSDS